MKKILNIISVFALSVALFSCNALDMEPKDFYASGNFWKNTAQVDGYMNGLHSNLRGRYQMFFYYGEARGGTHRTGTSVVTTSINDDRIKNNLLDKDNPGISNWYSLYSAIMQVNHFIDNVENGCEFLSDADRNYFLGQAYGLRALYYFTLYRAYGGVPIVKTVELLNGQISADKFYVARNTPEETLAFIKEDIGKSESFFGANTTKNQYLWNKYATLMLKTEIYLWSAKVTTGNHTATGTADLNVAKTALQGVIGQYSLLANFSDVFVKSSNTKNEVIFAIRFSDTEATNNGGEFLYATADVSKLRGRDGVLYASDTLNLKGTGGPLRHEYKEALWRSYDATDLRRDATFLDTYGANATDFAGTFLKKCTGTINSTNARIYETDIIIYRYADALLLMAEIENGLGGSCAQYINQVRQRAYGTNYNASVTYTDGSYADNEMAILHERDKEFVWEGKRWFDVVRLHDASNKSLVFSAAANYPATYGQPATALLSTTEAYKILWPIDVNTLNINDLLEQTPGY